MQVFLRGDIIDRRQQQCEQAESNLGNATYITMENSTGFVDVQSTNNTVARCFSFPSSLKCPFLQAVSSSIVWSLILFGRYYPSVLIYNATVASNARVRCNPIFPKLGREDSYNFFLPVAIRCVYFLYPVVPAKLQYSPHFLSIRVRKCERSRQSSVPFPTNLGALDFLKFDILVRNTAEQMRFNFSRLTNQRLHAKNSLRG